MTQQINLYKPHLFEKTTRFSGRRMLSIFLVFCGGLMLLGLAGEWRERRMDAQLEEMQNRHAILRTAVEELQGKANAGSHLLAQEFERLRAERDHLRLLLHKVETVPVQAQRGFSPYLEGLARQTVPGLWLRRIVLRGGGDLIRLEGSAGHPQEVPRLVHQLKAEAAFSGIEFAGLKIEQAQEANRPIDFILSTQPLEER